MHKCHLNWSKRAKAGDRWVVWTWSMIYITVLIFSKSYKATVQCLSCWDVKCLCTLGQEQMKCYNYGLKRARSLEHLCWQAKGILMRSRKVQRGESEKWKHRMWGLLYVCLFVWRLKYIGKTVWVKILWEVSFSVRSTFYGLHRGRVGKKINKRENKENLQIHQMQRRTNTERRQLLQLRFSHRASEIRLHTSLTQS